MHFRLGQKIAIAHVMGPDIVGKKEPSEVHFRLGQKIAIAPVVGPDIAGKRSPVMCTLGWGKKLQLLLSWGLKPHDIAG